MRLTKLGMAVACAVVLGATTAAADVKIAVIGPMTGQLAALGEQMKLGAGQAVEDINAAGGVAGEPISVEFVDDQCDPKQAVAAANLIAGKEVVFVAGHLCSGSSIPASKVYEDEGIVMISPASTAPDLTDQGGDMIFRVAGRDDQQGQVAGGFLAETFGDKVIAIVHDKSAYGQGLAEQTKKALNAKGIDEVLFEGYNVGDKDFAALVAKLKELGAEVLYVGGLHTEAGLILRQMREQGLQTQLMSGDALVTEEFWAITGDAGEGTLMTFNPDPRRNEAAKKVVETYKANGVDPEGYVLYTYTAVQAWAEAANEVGSTDPAEVAAALHETELDTVLGKITFDEKGDVSAPGFVVYRWSKGKYDYH